MDAITFIKEFNRMCEETKYCDRCGFHGHCLLNMVYCKHCGLESPWVKGGNAAVIEAWNAMILEKRKEQING